MLAPSPTLTLAELDRTFAELERKERKRAKDRERARAKRAARRAAKDPHCASCGRPLYPHALQVHRSMFPGTAETNRVRTEPCCPYCQNMVWRTQLWWMVKTQRFKLPEAAV